jgi:hypothetical protein
MSWADRHRHAVAATLGLAQEAAASGDFDGALKWLVVVEIVDDELPADWEDTRDVWRRRRAAVADRGRTPPASSPSQVAW